MHHSYLFKNSYNHHKLRTALKFLLFTSISIFSFSGCAQNNLQDMTSDNSEPFVPEYEYTYQAEDGIFSGEVCVSDKGTDHSGTGYVTGFYSADDKWKTVVDSPDDGFYDLVFSVRCIISSGYGTGRVRTGIPVMNYPILKDIPSERN